MGKQIMVNNQCPICGRPTHIESKYCIFHASAEEKTVEEFKKALKEYIEKIKKNNLDYNFFEFIFVGKIDFKEEFKLNTFKHVNFMRTTFKDEVTFRNTTFESEASFEWVTFKSVVLFIGTTFKSYALFHDTIFKKYVDFGETTFWSIADFADVTFDDDAIFEDVIFKGTIGFEDAIFKKNVHFSWAKLPPGKLLSLTVKDRSNIFFEQTFLEYIILSLDLEKDTFIDFKNVILRNTRIKMEEIDSHILQEHEKTFSEAKAVYLLLKNNFHSIGQYEDESWAFKKEKDMERKNNCHFKSLHKWLWSCFLNGIYGYGEKPGRVFLSSILIILIFACVFMNCGIASPPLDNVPKYNILKELSMGILYGDLLNKYKAIPKEHLTKSLYFSTVTFTTLGLGDFRPVENNGRIFVGLEAFIGAFMMALFVYTFARRTGGK